MKSQAPKVSVIVPVYNVAPWLPRCLDSLVNQTLPDIEIICVDDKSTDNSLEILRQYAARFSQIHVIEQEKNGGVSVARNTGLAAAHGEYVGFVDPDDYVDLDFYEKLYAVATNEAADIVKGNIECVDLEGRRSTNDECLAQIMQFGKWRLGYPWNSCMFRVKMLRKNNITFDTNINHGEDVLFLVTCTAAAHNVGACTTVFYHYIRREGSLDGQFVPPHKISMLLQALEQITDIYNNADISPTEYADAYFRAWKLIFFILQKTTSLEQHLLLADAAIRFHTKCKDSNGLMQLFIRENGQHKELFPFIISQDTTGFAECWRRILFAKPAIMTDGQPRRTYAISLFDLLPILRITTDTKTFNLKLFGIQIVKIKLSRSVVRVRLLYIPILRIKKNTTTNIG